MNKIARLCLLAGVFGIIAYPCVAADDQDDVRSSEHCCHTTHEVMNDPVFVEDSFFPKNNGYESFSSDRSSRCSAEDSFNIPAQNMFVPKSLGTIAIAYKGKEFYVINDKGEFLVQRYNLSKELREIDNEKLKKFISSGYLSLKKVGDEYAITHNFRLLGGGPVSGAVAYWLTKTLCYGTAVAAVTTVVVTTGGAAGALTSVGATLATSGASTAVAVTGAAISGAGLASEAALATTAVVSSAGGIGGAVAAVESASLGAWAVFTAIPFLP